MTPAPWNTYYTGNQDQINSANAQINSNCGFPDAQTNTWANPLQAYQQDFWFILMPPPEGYMEEGGNSWTQDQMISGVTGVTQQQSQSDWWPPSPSPIPPGGI